MNVMKALKQASVTHTSTLEYNGKLGLLASLSKDCTPSQTVLLSRTKCSTERALFWAQTFLL